MKKRKAHVETWSYREVETSRDSIGKFVLTDLYSICSNCELCMPPTDFAAYILEVIFQEMLSSKTTPK